MTPENLNRRAGAGFGFDPDDLADDLADDEELDFGLASPLDNSELAGLFGDDELEAEPQAGPPIESRTSERLTMEQREHRMKRADTAADLIAAVGIPAAGESVHILGNGSFDAWHILTGLLAELGSAAGYLNTWTMNYEHAVELMELIDARTLWPCSFMSSENLRSRRPAVYATLLHGLRRRSCRFACLPAHTKVTLLRNEAAGVWLTMEGSANYSANPRLEQYVLSNSRQVFDFHRSWMDDAFTHAERRQGSA